MGAIDYSWAPLHLAHKLDLVGRISCQLKMLKTSQKREGLVGSIGSKLGQKLLRCLNPLAWTKLITGGAGQGAVQRLWRPLAPARWLLWHFWAMHLNAAPVMAGSRT